MDGFDSDKKQDFSELSPILDENSNQANENPQPAEEIVDEHFWNGITQPLIVRKKKTKSGKVGFRFTIVIGAVMLICGFMMAVITVRGQGTVANFLRGDEKISFTLPVAEKPELQSEKYDSDGRYTTEGLVQAVSPSVVEITVYSDVSSLVPSGQGSGVIMTEGGYIVTNAHVVANAVKGLKATLFDGSEYEAKIIGTDEKTDIAVIKISASELTPVEFGDSTQTVEGEDVAAIGSPAGYFNSVTKGIVSGTDRRIKLDSDSTSMKCIQVDAAINPGSSGGGLFNMWGQLIGITSSKLNSNNYENLGFAISIEQAKPVIEQLMAEGAVTGRVKIGVTYSRISQTTADIYGVEAGLYIVSINKSCDVANTKLAEGDIITEIEGQKTVDVTDIQSLFGDKKAGDEITCKICRLDTTAQKTEDFEITFKLMEDNGGLAEE